MHSWLHGRYESRAIVTLASLPKTPNGPAVPLSKIQIEILLPLASHRDPES